MNDDNDRPLAIATWRYIRAPEERADAAVPWSRLAARLTAQRDRPADKMRLPLWSPVAYRAGFVGRGNAGVVSLSALVLDFDEGDVARSVERWKRYRMAWHTSWSSTAETMRARVVLPLAADHPAEHWPAVWAWLASLGITNDTKCKDVARAFYVGCPGEDGSWAAGVVDGPLLDVSHLRVAPPAAKPPTAGIQRRAGVVGALRSERLIQLRDPVWREQAGARVGGVGDGVRVRHARCPSCGRSSVWWWVDPATWHGAACEHRNSCGWAGSVEEVTGA